MASIKSIRFKKLIGSDQEAAVLRSITEFSCKDKEVEDFLKSKAIEFDKRHKSRTYLIMDTNRYIILGYYTLTMKNLEFGETLSKSVIKRIDGFSKEVQSTEAILIGQLGKNQNYQNDIDGQLILTYAIDTVYKIRDLTGGRIVFLECYENPKIVEFYRKNGFEPLQKSEDYLQMIRYL